MKTALIALSALIFILCSTTSGFPQDQEKARARLTAEYFREMDGARYLAIRGLARFDKRYDPAPEMELDVYQNYNDSTYFLGSVITDINGIARFDLEGMNPSSITENEGAISFTVVLEDQERYTDATRNIDVQECFLEVAITEEDSIAYISVSTSNYKEEPLGDVEIKVYVDRFFSPLPYTTEESESWTTEEDGTIVVPIITDLPGDEAGNLSFLVRIEENDDFGNVEARFSGVYGIPVESQSYTKERELWSLDAPFWMVITFWILMIGVWIHYLWMIFNLRKLGRNKTPDNSDIVYII